MRWVLLGVLLGLCAAFPHAAGQGAAPVLAAGHWLAGQPLLWAFCAGIVARPHLARRIPRRLR